MTVRSDDLERPSGVQQSSGTEQPERVVEPDPAAAPTPASPGRRRWCWGTRIVLVACLAWLGYIVAHRLLSGRTYWWGPWELEPPLVLAVIPVVLAALAWFARPIRWRLTLVPAAALLLSAEYTGINVATIWYTPPPAPPGAITVVSWNTMYWDQDLMSDGQRTTAEFYQFLRGLDADVYLLHEYAHVDFTRQDDIFAQVQVIDQLAQVREVFPEYEAVVVGRNLTLSRLPIVGSHGVESTPWLPEDLKEPPPALRPHPTFYNVQTVRTDIEVMGQTVSFYNPHLYHPPSHPFTLEPWPGHSARWVYRFTHSMRLAGYQAIVADMADNPYPLVLAGDLNTTPAMELRNVLPDRLVDHTRALSSLYPTSWTVGGPNGERGWALDAWRLDWLFTTPDVAVHSYELRDPAGFSDHRLQHAVLSVAG
jgi:Endonuclease/Exonuclease/phosphatase family